MRQVGTIPGKEDLWLAMSKIGRSPEETMRPVFEAKVEGKETI